MESYDVMTIKKLFTESLEVWYISNILIMWIPKLGLISQLHYNKEETYLG